MKAVVLYEPAPDVMEKAPIHFPAHTAWLDTFHACGDLLAVGLFADRKGAMAILRTRSVAPLPADARRTVLGENALRFYNLAA